MCCQPDVLLIPWDFCVCTPVSCVHAQQTQHCRHVRISRTIRAVCVHTVDGKGERDSNKERKTKTTENICLKMSSLYCLHFSLHLQQGWHIGNISKTKSFWQPMSPLFTDAFLKTVGQVWAAGWSCQGNQKLNQPNIPSSSTKACLCLPHRLWQWWSWQYYLALTLFPVLGNQCLPRYSAFPRPGGGFRIDLAYFKLQKNLTFILTTSVFYSQNMLTQVSD